MAAAILLLLTAGAAAAAPAVDVLGYEVELAPDVAGGEVAGRETIRLRVLQDALTQLEFTASALRLEDVRVDGAPALAEAAGGRLLIRPARPLVKGRTASLSLRFSGRPRRGLVQAGKALHSSYFTCEWMVCDQEALGDLARLDLTLKVPPGLTAAASGRKVASNRWRVDAAAPFMFGWAAGEFVQVRPPGRGPQLLVLSDAASPGELAPMFADTGAMVEFFEAKAGVRYPLRGYTQVVTARSTAQEAAGMAFLGLAEVKPILADPAEDWAIAHELAHQWWGVRVAAQDLSHFWLNEGMAVFMTAAWKERRWGRPAYEREMGLARRRWQAAQDRPLAYPGAYPDLRARRAIVYSKAALFLDALRTEVGEDAFWRGVRLYTRAQAGRTANSADFQRAMEQAAGRSLQPLFETWVYGDG